MKNARPVRIQRFVGRSISRPSVNLLTVAAVAAMPASMSFAAEAFSFGLNTYGQIGNGTSGTYVSSTVNSPISPVSVLGMRYGITVYAAGGGHSLMVKSGALYGWGLTNYGSLGNGVSGNNPTPVASDDIAYRTPTPQQGVVLTSGVTAVQASAYSSFAIANGGTMYSWGGNFDAILSNGTANNNLTATPTPVVGLGSGPVTSISAGSRHVVAIQNGALYAWGYTVYGQIGNGVSAAFYGNVTAPAATPYQVPGFSTGTTLAAAGGFHTLAVVNNKLYAWGSNQYGQLGLGPDSVTGTGTFDAFYNTPRAVPGMPTGTITDISAGGSFSMALVNGSVYTWGRSESGQLGNGSFDTSTSPVPVVGISGTIVDVEAGSSSAYALGADGTLWTWGNNERGQLGIGTTDTPFETPQHLFASPGYRFDGIDASASASHVIVTESALPVYFTGASGTSLNDVANLAANVAGTTPAPIATVESTDVFFGAATATPTTLATATVATALNANSLTFGTGTSASSPVTISGPGTITLYVDKNTYAAGVGIVKQAGSAAATINVPLALAASQSWTNSSATALTVGGSVTLGTSSLTLAGTNAGGTTIGGVISGDGSVTVTSAGTTNLTGANTYTGITTVSNGGATVHVAYAAGASAATPLLSGAGANIAAGAVAFDYTGATPAATIRGLLQTAYANGFATGQIKSTTATSSKGLGYKDTGTSVIVKSVLYGDADLDGGVTINDFNLLALSFGTSSGKVWINGDFDYDGGVGIADFNKLALNFGTSLPASADRAEAMAGLMAFAIAHDDLPEFYALTGVPEPTSLGLIGVGAMFGLRRRRNAAGQRV